MASKRLVFIYYYGPQNEDIARTDYEQSFRPIRTEARAHTDLKIQAEFCPSVTVLIDKIKELFDPRENIEELYLHFSGHGNVVGIPYGEWLLNNNDLGTILDHDKVKCCFFSSCQSADLVKVVQARNIPVIVGTAGQNEITNSYAIAFQNNFYQYLMKGVSFLDAFEKAYAETKYAEGGLYKAGEIRRGESGTEPEEGELNQLQIAFATEAARNLMLLPPNFLRKMNNMGYDKPFCLNWFDDHIVAGAAYLQAFLQAGYDDLFRYLEIPSEEIPLLDDRGDEDPLSMGEVRLFIHCSRSERLPEFLRKHISNPAIFKMSNYKVVLCLKEGVQRDIVLDGLDTQIVESLPLHTYSVHIRDLFGKNDFLRMLEWHEVDHSERRKAILNFNSKPLKDEIVEVPGENQFVRIFFARNANENLINFLINWIRNKEAWTSPVFVIDNRISRDMNFKEALEQELQSYFKNAFKLRKQLVDMYGSGSIVVIRNKSDDMSTTASSIEELIRTMSSASDVFEDEGLPKCPTFVFFLLEGDTTPVIQVEDKLWLKKLSTPLPVDEHLINEWRTAHNPVYASGNIVKLVKDVAGRIPIEDLKDCCPSHVIEFICDEFKIPRKQVVGIT